MATRTTPEQDAERGRRIAAFLADEHVQDLLAGIEAQHLEAIRNSEPGECEKREGAYHMLRAVKALRDAMTGAVNSGKFSQAKLNRQS
jgi:hypothetical protein